MPKTIYTERDIDELARRGVKEIAVTDQVYLTDVARERAEKLGITLSNTTVPSSPGPGSTQAIRGPRPDAEDVIGKVKADVIAKLGPAVDPVLIDRIVRRVVSQLK